MHFTGYQPDNTRNKEFCEDIPATGRTVVVARLYGRCTPPLPPSAVIKDTGSEQDLSAITVLHLPPRSTQRTVNSIQLRPARQIRVWSPWAQAGAGLAIPVLIGRRKYRCPRYFMIAFAGLPW